MRATPDEADVPPQQQAAGVRAVFDTNVHLHFPRFDQYDWAAELGGPVEVVVPLVVLEELDRHKNQGRPVLGDRAGRVARTIEDLVEEHGGRVHERMTVSLALEPDGHQRRPSVDAEIVAVAAALAGESGAPVVMVTDDAGLRAQARARGLTVHRPRAEPLPSTDPAAAKLRKDQQEVDKILAARPDARVTFADGEALLVLPPPRQLITQKQFVSSALSKAEEKHPALDVVERPQGLFGLGGLNWDAASGSGSARRYNGMRDDWLRWLAAWAAREYERLVRKVNAVDLGLCGRNAGGAAAEDVEVRIELPDRDRSVYLREDDVEAAEDKPEPPPRPTPGFNLPSVQVPAMPRLNVRPAWTWDVDADGRTAVLHVDRVLQGDLPRPFGPTLLLIPRSGAIVRPVRLNWSMTGANPPFGRSGALTLMPEALARRS